MNRKDYDFFKKICRVSQEGLRITLSKYINNLYNKTYITDNYIMAEGNIPIALVAHMDTVFKAPPTNIYYDREEEIIWSPNGLGADDRAGIYSILQILGKGYRPHVIFTTDEELGAVGASNLTIDYRKLPFKKCKYLIQLDRRGQDDCVFYDCDNEEFNEYVESFGFLTAFGSFSDISVIAPTWEVAAVNLSIGYQNEHTTNEILNVKHMEATINKVINMLKDSSNINTFKYIPSINYYDYMGCYRYWQNYNYNKLNEEEEDSYTCHFCKTPIKDISQMVVVKDKDGNCLPACIHCADTNNNKIDYCAYCGDPYVIEDKSKDFEYGGICNECRKEFGL